MTLWPLVVTELLLISYSRINGVKNVGILLYTLAVISTLSYSFSFRTWPPQLCTLAFPVLSCFCLDAFTMIILTMKTQFLSPRL